MRARKSWRGGLPPFRQHSFSGRWDIVMGKRSEFERKERDFYPTPYEAVVPLLSQLPRPTRFAEPCAGDGALVDHLMAHGHVCARARDIDPRRCDIDKKDALTTLTGNIDFFITNPPWEWKILDPLIRFLSEQHPTWLLLNADVMHNKRMGPHMKKCSRVVSVGRVKWMPGSKNTGMENCAWMLFQAEPSTTTFIGR